MKITDEAVYYYSKTDWPSNFYPAPFYIKLFNSKDPYYARTGEHAFHMAKAALFNDIPTLLKIQKAKTPFEALSLGRTVRNFDKDVWNKRAHAAMDFVHETKLNAYPELRKEALALHPRRFVEASPRDSYWGCGLAKDNPNIVDVMKWRGSNHHGASWDRVLRAAKERG